MDQVVTIERIIAGGDGLARQDDGRVVFVPRTAPGDKVAIEIVEEHRQWARARLIDILEPGAGRREASCPLYEGCSGCQMQHLNYPTQLSAKSALVADSLRRLAAIDASPADIVSSDQELHYRNRVTFLLRRRLDDIVAGYRQRHDPREIIDVDECPLAEEPINRVWAALRAAWRDDPALLPAEPELRLTLRSTADGQVGLVVEGGSAEGDPEALLARVPGLASIWRFDDAGKPDWYVGSSTLDERWGRHAVRVAGTSFLQVNREVAAKLDVYVRESCGDVRGRKVVDAYCGFGLRALELAWAGARVSGIDTDEHAIAMAQAAAAESGAPARFVLAEVEEALGGELPADLVILNPPRAGLSRQVVSDLLGSGSERLVYVSCDAATLARDLKRLDPDFRVASCLAFDMFPQTAHVETVVTLEGTTGARL